MKQGDVMSVVLFNLLHTSQRGNLEVSPSKSHFSRLAQAHLKIGQANNVSFIEYVTPYYLPDSYVTDVFTDIRLVPQTPVHVQSSLYL